MRSETFFLFCAVAISAYPANGLAQDKFTNAGFDADSQFVAFYHQFQRAVRNDDSLFISTLLQYPTQATLNIRKPLKLKNPRAFLQHYREIFDDRLKELILSQPPDNFFANYQGVMIGNGQIWFTVLEGGKITIPTINNHRELYR